MAGFPVPWAAVQRCTRLSVYAECVPTWTCDRCIRKVEVRSRTFAKPHNRLTLCVSVVTFWVSLAARRHVWRRAVRSPPPRGASPVLRSSSIAARPRLEWIGARPRDKRERPAECTAFSNAVFWSGGKVEATSSTERALPASLCAISQYARKLAGDFRASLPVIPRMASVRPSGVVTPTMRAPKAGRRRYCESVGIDIGDEQQREAGV